MCLVTDDVFAHNALCQLPFVLTTQPYAFVPNLASVISEDFGCPPCPDFVAYLVYLTNCTFVVYTKRFRPLPY